MIRKRNIHSLHRRIRQQIVRLYLNIRHIFRLAARKLGLSGYQVHQIYLKNLDLIYIPIPKNACTSLKHAMHYLEYHESFDLSNYRKYGYQSLHDFYNKQRDAFTGIEALKKHNAFCFTVIRDPIDRFLSCYGNRVVQLGDLQKSRNKLDRIGLSSEPDLDTFALNLVEYRRMNPGIRHHTELQSNLLGGTLEYADKTFPFEELNSLQNMLNSYDSTLVMKSRKSGGPKFQLSDLSHSSLQFLLEFYKKDYELFSEFYSSEDVLKRYRTEHSTK
ncbi:MAG: sulfotransferase family 2 domain-containing protein [Balneolaceae bacterium]|nr:sulfotransferase family 2 domain-containing protein [Balneolaceae bacterium]